MRSLIVLTVTLGSSLFVGGCTPDFYAEQAVDLHRSQMEQEAEQKRQQEINKRFDRLEEHLGIEESAKEPTQEMVDRAFPASFFPRQSCGDVLPSKRGEYPVNFYPVFIPNEGNNLERVTRSFCADAFATTDQYGNKVVQVASFYTEKAHEFVSLMEEEFSEARLGEPTPISYRE
jgi:hypothetical protein